MNLTLAEPAHLPTKVVHLMARVIKLAQLKKYDAYSSSNQDDFVDA